MIHYWGAAAIQDRVGVKSLSGLRGLIAREHLPVFRRIKKLPGIRPRRVLYTNSLLVTTWELGQARLEVERAQAFIERKNKQRREARQQSRMNTGQSAPSSPVPAAYQFAKVRSREPQT